MLAPTKILSRQDNHCCHRKKETTSAGSTIFHDIGGTHNNNFEMTYEIEAIKK